MLQLVPNCTLPIPAGALCRQTPVGAVVFRDAPPLPHPRQCGGDQFAQVTLVIGICFVLQAVQGQTGKLESVETFNQEIPQRRAPDADEI